MKKDPGPVTIQILDKEYRIACSEGEEDALLAAARYLDTRMREIRAGGKVIGTDRIAVLAALNMANDLLTQTATKTSENLAGSADKRVRSLRDRIEIALNDSNQLEL